MELAEVPIRSCRPFAFLLQLLEPTNPGLRLNKNTICHLIQSRVKNETDINNYVLQKIHLMISNEGLYEHPGGSTSTAGIIDCLDTCLALPLF